MDMMQEDYTTEDSMSNSEFEFEEQEHSLVEFIPNRLFFCLLDYEPTSTQECIFFSTDNLFHYDSFASDFGPLKMSQLVRFCRFLMSTLQNDKRKVCYYASDDFETRTNAAYLISSFMVLCQNYTPEEAFKPIKQSNIKLLPYRDAGKGPSLYKLELIDCLRGLYRGLNLGWINVWSFDIKEYEYYEKVENGDWNWIVPGKFLGFATPKGKPKYYYDLPPAYYVPHFKRIGVTTVIRLNDALYNGNDFQSNGIKHYDMIFPDGHNPPDHILEEFLDVCHREKGGIAVHCMAGLGRTGTLIGAYMIKHYGFTAPEVMGYMRICRPGCIVGPQQLYIIDYERSYKEGREDTSYLHSHSSELFTPQPRKNDGVHRGLINSPVISAKA